MSKERDQAASSALASSFLLGAIFLLSGSVALIYEAAWQRQFTLLFGSAAPATAAVLGAYFAGLGLGSYVLGKVSSRWRQPLRVYGFLEWVIAAGALLVAPILSLYGEVYPGLFARFQGGGTVFLLVKGLLAFAAIAIPTMAMGGTLPALAQIFDSRRAQFGELAGWLYMLNAAGAAIGVLLFPRLLAALGMRNTIYLCAALNVLIGAGAFIMVKAASAGSGSAALRPVTGGPKPVRNRDSKRQPGVREAATVPEGPIRKWVGLAFISGFVTFVLQVGWSRAFAQIHENSVYSFSFIVALFIAAIAAGAQLARIILHRRWLPAKAMGRAWVAGGFLTLIGPMIFLQVSGGLKFEQGGSGSFVPGSNMLVAAFAVVFVPVVLLAAGLPLILQEVASLSKRATGDLTGTVLAGNVAGSVAGAIAAGFLFPYTLGLWSTILLTSTIILAAASLLLGRTFVRRLALVVGSVLIAWVVSLQNLPRTRIDTGSDEKLVAIKEGTHGVVAVVERPGSRRLKLNNHYVLGGTSAVGDERMQAHIPLLLHPNPQRVAFLGYGTGITAGGSFFHAPTSVTALELVPEVAEMAGTFFAEANHSFAAQPFARIVIDDARNYLRGTRDEFDVLIGDLVVPWRHGEGALYTLEHFAAARRRLAPGGLYCSWLPMFQLGEEDFDSIVRTFLEVFPKAYIWRGDFSPTEPALALVGFMAGGLNPENLHRRVQQMQPDPTNPQLKYSRAVWMNLVGIAGTASHQLNTEDRPRVELRVNRSPPFVGRKFHAWENQIRDDSMSVLRAELRADDMIGWEAGRLMGEFTLLMVEGKQNEANTMLQKLRDTLGAEVARSIFGN